MVYAREIGGVAHTFGVSGKLIMNSLVMYDRETESLWSQFIGEAVKGILAGTKLELLPSQITTWSDWKSRHPDTLVLDTGLSQAAGGRYQSYFRSPQAGTLGRSNFDDRLYPKEHVIGVFGQSSHKAYGYRYLVEDPLIHDTFEDRPILLTFNEDGAALSVFDRTVNGQALTFEGTDDVLLMSDTETGSTWSMETGEAVDGPLKGSQLATLSFTTSFWFGWADFYPDTEVYVP